MKREHIAERLRGSPNTVAAGLCADIYIDIAERALPVTREWLDANFKRIDGEFVAESRHGKIVIWLRTDGKLRLSVLSSSYAIDTRGDLFDVLTGLGVRK